METRHPYRDKYGPSVEEVSSPTVLDRLWALFLRLDAWVCKLPDNDMLVRWTCLAVIIPVLLLMFVCIFMMIRVMFLAFVQWVQS